MHSVGFSRAARHSTHRSSLIILRKALQRVALSSTLDSAGLPASAPVCLDRLVELQEMGCHSGMTGALWGWTALSQGGSARHAVLPTTATICCTLWIRACPDCWSAKGYDAMLGCLPSASVDHASLARHSCLQASSVLFWLWLTLAAVQEDSAVQASQAQLCFKLHIACRCLQQTVLLLSGAHQL